MECANCGKAAAAGQRFCAACGGSLPSGCPRCGHVGQAGDRFCGACGAALNGSPAAAIAADPARHAPSHLVERVLRQRESVAGEHKEVTVLFADIKGSMDLASAVDAEELHSILDRYFAILAEGVYRFDGCINQFAGDGIMALFGAPLALEDHAQHACFAALALRDAVREFGNELRRERGLDFAVRFGLNSGGVIVGSIGDDLRMDYTAQGQVVNLAARMEQLAEAGTIYLAPATAALVQGYFDLHDLGVFRVKGIADGVRIHELRGMGDLRTRLDASRARGLSKFVGRKAELDLLERATSPSGGRRIRIVAAAGLGKSRLCLEFLVRRRASAAVVFETVGLSHARTIASVPLRQLFRAVLGIDEGERGASVRERVAGRILLFGEEYRYHAAVVSDLLGLDAEAVGSAPEGEALRQRLLEVMLRLLGDTAERNEVVLYFDDLQWFDPASFEFARALFSAELPDRVSLVVSHRPDLDGDWIDDAGFATIRLEPLGAVDVRELLTALLGDSPKLADLMEQIAEWTAGNPFFAEEVVRTLVESGHLRGNAGNYTSGDAVAVEIPASVHAVLAARIDRLSDRSKGIVQAAAVIGKRFAHPVLAATCALEPGALEAGLAELIERGFVYVTSRYPVAEYSFEHPLTQEVAEKTLLSSRRRALHASVARAIEGENRDRVDERAALVALHWESAGEALLAAEWHGRAAVWSRRGDLQQTYAHWEKVRVLIPVGAADVKSVALRLLACRELLALSTRVGVRSTKLHEFRAEGCDAASRLGDDTARAAIESSYALARALEGNLTEALEILSEVRSLVSTGGEVDSLMEFALTASHVYSWSGNCLDQIDVAELGLRAKERDGAGRDAIGAWLLVMRGDGLARLGRLDEGEREIRAGSVLASRVHDLEVQGFALTSLCRLHTIGGRYEEAERATRQAIAIGRQVGSLGVWGTATTLQAAVLVAARRWAEAIAELEPMVKYLADAGIVLYHTFALTQLALCLCGTGEAALGSLRAAEALRMAQRSGARMFEIIAHIAVARAAALLGDRQSAGRHLDHAGTEVEALALKSMQADVHLARADIALAGADVEAAAHWRAMAVSSLRAIGATGRAAAIEAG